MEPIKQEIINNIFENGDKLITGPILQTVLIDMIDDVNVKDQEILSKTGSWDDAATQIPNLATKAEVTNLSESVARDLENVVDVDLTGYATEQWVESQGYLKEHQDISNLATKTELTEAETNLQGNITSLSESVARDLANVDVDLTGYATETWVQNQGYLTEHQDISGLATKTEVTSLSESVARDLANVPEGVATEAWVQSQDYASKSYVDNAVSSSSVDLTGYATETWVESQGYLTEHQDISNLATKTELNDTKDNIQSDMLILSESMAKTIDDYTAGLITEIQNQDYASKTYVNEAISSSSVDLTGYATEQWVESQGYLKEHQDISNLATKTELTSVSESVQTDISNLATKTELNDTKNNLQGNITSLSESVARDLTGYATEQWVENQGYLKEHQDISGLATKSELTSVSESVQTDITNLSESVARDLTGYATETWVQNQGYLTEHQDISNLATKTELTSVSESVQTDITNLSESVANSAVWKKGTGEDSIVQVIAENNGDYTPLATGKGAIATGLATTASGGASHAEGEGTKALDAWSHAEGLGTKASGRSSHAEGEETVASGVGSHAEGIQTIATNTAEHAQGRYNYTSSNQIFSVGAGEKIGETVTRRNAVSILEVPNSETQVVTASVFVQNVGGYDGTNPTPGTNDLATVVSKVSSIWEKGEGQNSLVQVVTEDRGKPTASGERAIATGYNTYALGMTSHAEGSGTRASGSNSHAEGSGTNAEGESSHAEGEQTFASADYSHAEGYATVALGQHSHTEGYAANTLGSYSHAEGNFTKASGSYSHAEGYITNALGDASHAEGAYTTASGDWSHAEGRYTTASGYYSHAEGHGTTTPGTSSHAEGAYTITLGSFSHAEGAYTTASGDWSHAEGDHTNASGYISHAEGAGTTASGQWSHAEGQNTNASGLASHTEGAGTTALGQYSHAEGDNTVASGSNSHAEGSHTNTSNDYEHAQGRYNYTSSNQIFSIGAGERIVANEGTETETVTETRRNAISVLAVPNSETQITTASVFVQNIGGYDGTNPLPGTNDLATVINNLPSGGGGSSETLWKKGTGQDSMVQKLTGDYEAYTSTATGIGAVAIGTATTASGEGSRAEGDSTTASGYGSHTEGQATAASGQYSHAEGAGTIAANPYEHAQGMFNHSSENQIFSVGAGKGEPYDLEIAERRNAISVLAVKNNSNGSHTASFFVQNIGGYDGTNPTPGTNDLATVINNLSSSVGSSSGGSSSGGSSETLWKKGEGTDSIVQIKSSGIEGALFAPTATGTGAIATGRKTNASGNNSHAEGEFTIASNDYEHAQGIYNHSSKNQIFSIGAGDNNSDRRNAVSVIVANSTSSFFVRNVGGYDGTNPEPGTNDLATVINSLSSGGGSSSGESGDYLPLTGGTLTGDLRVNSSMGVGTGPQGTHCLAVGDSATNTARSHYALAVGENCQVAGAYGGVSLGRENVVDAAFGLATGFRCRTTYMAGYAGGCRSTASANFAFAAGFGAEATRVGQVVLGAYNELDPSGNNESTGSYAVILANGKSSTWHQDRPGSITRSNGLAIKWDGGIDIKYRDSTITLQDKLNEIESKISSGGTGTSTETWTFTLGDGTTVTKNIILG